MYIRIQFDDLLSQATQQTQWNLSQIPNGTFLTSFGARPLRPAHRDANGGIPFMEWYLDDEVIREKYGGIEHCFDVLRGLPGICSLEVRAS